MELWHLRTHSAWALGFRYLVDWEVFAVIFYLEICTHASAAGRRLSGI